MRESDEALAWWMLGVSAAHGLRFLLFDDPVGRMVVAGAGALVYSLAALCAADRATWTTTAARWIAVLFPVVGLLTVLVLGERPDDWQIAVGVTQVAAMVYALRSLFKS